MKIKVTDADKLASALAAVNGKAVVHTLGPREVQAAAKRAEALLDSAGLPKALRQGITLTVAPAGPGKAYARKSRAVVSTRVTLLRGANAWYLTGAERIDLWATATEHSAMQITPEQADSIARKALSPFTVA